jgi:beta-glucosidase
MHEVANAIAIECKTRGIRQVLSPVVNIASDVRWGRTEETYGEDPFLASEMGVAFVSAFENMGVITTPKHFVANVGDGGRDSYPIHWNERLMREIHLPPFEACFKRGGSRSVMTSYNSYDGSPCTANDWLLNQLLKEEWQFDGFVISDAGGTGGANVLHFTASGYEDATAKSLNAGLDVIFQTSYDHYTLFSPPFYDGTISPEIIDRAVARVLKLKFELGLFENPYVEAEEAAAWNGHPAHRELARQAALESVVLLKNENRFLPFSGDIKSIAVIGPDAAEVRLGGYSGPGNQKISILEGIKNRAGSGIAVSFTQGCTHHNTEFVSVPGELLSCQMDGLDLSGLKGEYFNNVSFSGEPAFIRNDKRIQFQWTLFSPDPEKLSYDFWSVRWSGKLKAPKSGTFKIGIDGNDGYRLYLDGNLLLDNWIKRGRQVVLADFYFEKGREYDLKIEFYEPVGNAWFRLIWNLGIDDLQSDEIEKAVQLANNSDLVVLAVGIEEGEFLDRAYLHLPGRQEELILRVAETGTPVVVVLVGGSAVTMSKWMDAVQSIVQVWYPGEAGGQAIAEVLFGDYNPAGRLPITFPVFEGQLPLVYNHKPTGRGDDYMNLTGQPLFPFGFGLSYTAFEYSNIRLTDNQISKNETTQLSVDVKNIGNTAGDEVVQLYLRDELASVARPVMELKAFRRIHLQAGESKTITFAVDPEMLAMYDLNMNKIVEPGIFRLMVGASSKDIRQRIFLDVSE